MSENSGDSYWANRYMRDQQDEQDRRDAERRDYWLKKQEAEWERQQRMRNRSR